MNITVMEFRWPALLALFLISIFPSAARSASIVYDVVPDGNAVLTISGPIREGLYNDVISAIREQNNILPDVVSITSGGGDLAEAIKLGSFFRQALSVVTPAPSPPGANFPCNSACAVIVLSSRIYPVGDEVIGLHRPYFDPAMFGELSIPDARRRYQELEAAFRSYLDEMGARSSIVDRIMATASDEVWYVSMGEFVEMNGQPAYVQEWLKAKCPASMSQEEREQYEAIQNYSFFLNHLESCPDFFSGQRNPAGAGCDWAGMYYDRFQSGPRIDEGRRQDIVEKMSRSLKCSDDTIRSARQDLIRSLGW